MSCCPPGGALRCTSCLGHRPLPAPRTAAQPNTARQPGPPEVDLDHQLPARVLGHEQVAAQRHAGIAGVVERRRRVGVVEARAQGAVAKEAAVWLGRTCAAQWVHCQAACLCTLALGRWRQQGSRLLCAGHSERLTGCCDGWLRGRRRAWRGPRRRRGRQAGPGGGRDLADEWLLRVAVLSLPAKRAVRRAHVKVHLRQLRSGVIACSSREQEGASALLLLARCGLPPLAATDRVQQGETAGTAAHQGNSQRRKTCAPQRSCT